VGIGRGSRVRERVGVEGVRGVGGLGTGRGGLGVEERVRGGRGKASRECVSWKSGVEGGEGGSGWRVGRGGGLVWGRRQGARIWRAHR